jgi:hypothetical protein
MEAFTFFMMLIIYWDLRGLIKEEARKNRNATHAVNAKRVKYTGIESCED